MCVVSACPYPLRASTRGQSSFVFSTRSSSIASASPRCYTESRQRAPRLQLHSWVPSSCAEAVPRRALRGPSSPISLRFPCATDTLSTVALSSHSPQSPPMPLAPPRHSIARRPVNRHHRPLLWPVSDGSPPPKLPRAPPWAPPPSAFLQPSRHHHEVPTDARPSTACQQLPSTCRLHCHRRACPPDRRRREQPDSGEHSPF
jgi:hypothetical protein